MGAPVLAGYAADPRRQAVAATAVRGLCRFAHGAGDPGRAGSSCWIMT